MKRMIAAVFSAVILLGLFASPIKASAADSGSSAGVVATAVGSLNVRASAGGNAPVVTTLSKGTHVTLVSKSGSWWKVEYGKNLYGYCHADYIRQISGTAVSVHTSSGSLNVRSGPGTGYAKQGSLYKGETVIELSTSGGWSKILYHGTKTGYVSSQYLSSGNSPVSLWLPNLKQMDDRWKEVTVGTSVKTMAQIGCATTAIAMVESHRQGRTIYPDEMMGKLRYTPSGSVYWPEHYTTVTDSSGYLSRIYQLLKQGKPILFGAKNTYGKQHWVVITGYNGQGLSAVNFSINDPGSHTRTNLQQFLNAYPTFYKYFTY